MEEVGPRTLGELAALVGGQVVGDAETTITGVAALDDARPGDLAFVDAARFLVVAQACAASALIVTPSLAEELPERTLLVVARPRVAFAQLVTKYRPQTKPRSGIHPTAVIEPDAILTYDTFVGAHAFIGRGAVIGARVQLHPHAHIGADCCIGNDTVIHPHATLYHGVTLGQRVIVHAGAVLGSDGLGFEWVDGRHLKVPQVGTVIIEDEVEIGANCTIDRAALSATVIGAGTKLDNMVHVAHNCRIGKHCIIAAQVGIAGGVTLGDGVQVGGQAGFPPQVTIGAGARIAGATGVISDVPAGATYFGYPAGPHQQQMRMEAALKRLPELLKTVKRLERELAALRSATSPPPDESP